MNTPVVDKVIEQLVSLPSELQWRVLEFTRALAGSIPRGVPGQQLLRFAGAIPSSELQMIRQAIEEGCEQVDHSTHSCKPTTDSAENNSRT